jgi:eukaryotic-like serine/threonine-protein kinase
MADLIQELSSALGSTYRIERELGGGGMSRVFQADDIALGRSVVIKVLHPELAAGVNAERESRDALSRLDADGKLRAQIAAR